RRALGEPRGEEPGEDAIGPRRARIRRVVESELALEAERKPVGVRGLPFTEDNPPTQELSTPEIRWVDFVPGRVCGAGGGGLGSGWLPRSRRYATSSGRSQGHGGLRAGSLWKSRNISAMPTRYTCPASAGSASALSSVRNHFSFAMTRAKSSRLARESPP